MAADDRYGEPGTLRDAAGRPVGYAAAVQPGWPLKFTERRWWLPWFETIDRLDDARPAADDVYHAYDVRIISSERMTVTVRGADRRVLGRFADSKDSSPLGPHLFPRDDGPIQIAADAGDHLAVLTQTLRSVADVTAIRARTSGATTERGGVRLAVTKVAAWPGGVAVELTGRTNRPRDRVIVTTAPFVTRGEPATAVLSPNVWLRDDRGRTYPLLGADGVDSWDYHWYWHVRQGSEDPFALAAPESSIGLPATLLFGPVGDDVRSLDLEVDDVFVVGADRSVPYTIHGSALLSLLSRSWGDVVTLPLPDRAAVSPPERSQLTHPAPLDDSQLTSGPQYSRTLGTTIKVAGSRAVVESITSQGSDVTVRLRPLAGGFGRLLAVNARSIRADRRAERECDNVSQGTSWHDPGPIKIWWDWPTVFVDKADAISADPTAASIRLCFENPLIVVEDRWTIPLPAAELAADQRTNGTGTPR
ncbi:MAG: hypothetical protein U0470_00300 [Anaerolineae bacterium]